MAMNPRLLRPRASGFNPKSLPGFVYWLDASQASTITVSTGVSVWRDAGGSSINAEQSTASSQPAYQTAAQNGKNAVYFDGTNDNMTLGNLSAFFPSAATAIFAYKPNGDNEYSLYTDVDNNAFWAYPTGRTYIGTFKSTRLNNVASPLMPIDRGAVVAIVSSSSGYKVYVNNTLAHDVAADFATGTNHRLGQNNLGTAYGGWLYEAIFSSSALNASQLAAAYKYLDAKWNLSEAAAPTVSNADAQDWIGRVYTNGGTVSASTASAVNTFCNAIDTAGIRDRFYRLNLFAGTGLNAALVPLYRGPSRTGTQGGLTTDSNNGPFVSGDYSETAGLTGNGSSKHLRIGTLQSVYQGVPATGHMSVWTLGRNADNKRAMGVFDLTLQSGQPYAMYYGLGHGSSSQQEFGRAGILIITPPATSALLTANRSAANAQQYYTNTTQASTASDESINRDIPDASISVFGQSYYNWNNNTFSHGYEAPAQTFSSYSCGQSMSAAQITSYYNALVAFRTAMGRT